MRVIIRPIQGQYIHSTVETMTSEKIITQSNVRIQIDKEILPETYKISLKLESHIDCLLHWGALLHGKQGWQLLPDHLWPEGTRQWDQNAAQTTFTRHNGAAGITFELPATSSVRAIAFVLYFPAENRWDNNNHQNYQILIPPRSRPEAEAKPRQAPQTTVKPSGSPEESAASELAKIIIERETGPHSWTLMHRFNLCHDLLDRIDRGDTGSLALIFVWLRFSAIRQLDWQRNYNTQPRELSHAQNRLTLKLARRYAADPGNAQIIRLILSTLGRGGEGQRVRDEILNIMHRHHIKEISGHFMEEWHQKLHNNTTPDDVVICEAYIAFLQHDGALDRFYDTLERGGVGRQRLLSYDRPIRSDPTFVPHLKDALIRDFTEFLGILKSVHSATDLGTAIQSARPFLSAELNHSLNVVWAYRDTGKAGLLHLADQISKARKMLAEKICQSSESCRELLFLDISLENFMRVIVERNLHHPLSLNSLVDLIYLMIENRILTDADAEIENCRKHWRMLKDKPGKENRLWALQAHAVIERLGRCVGNAIDHHYELLQSCAEHLGAAFQADTWAVSLFTEEVVRGRPSFVMVMLLRKLNPLLRRIAHLGNWQIVSRGKGRGRVAVTDHLKSAQNKIFECATILIADKIAGDEEIPGGVTAIITPDTTDIVSHVAIRARNSRVLIATCYDPETLSHLKSLSGNAVCLNVNPAGEVLVEPWSEDETSIPIAAESIDIAVSPPVFSGYILQEKEYGPDKTGAKAGNLKRLRATVPDWVRIPASVAIPFGIFENVLAEDINIEIKEQYEKILLCLKKASMEESSDLLGSIRVAVSRLKAPTAVSEAFQSGLSKAGIAPVPDWEEAWACIKQVWASKWNERAFLNRNAHNINHERLFMAVLIQPLVMAEYAFVIHTRNPFTDNDQELYAEVVLGLGETLVGNHPGRALSFTLEKGSKIPYIRSFPSKSEGLFGTGLIFRSDSNAEDLSRYAGAGLYESVYLSSPQKRSLDYAAEPLIWDKKFQNNVLNAIARIGILTEKHAGNAQDIEGAYAQGEYWVVQARPQV